MTHPDQAAEDAKRQRLYEEEQAARRRYPDPLPPPSVPYKQEFTPAEAEAETSEVEVPEELPEELPEEDSFKGEK